MRFKKNFSKQQEKEFYDRIVYPEQFNGSVVKLTYHVYNLFYPRLGGSQDKIKKVVQIYLPDTCTVQYY